MTMTQNDLLALAQGAGYTRNDELSRRGQLVAWLIATALLLAGMFTLVTTSASALTGAQIEEASSSAVSGGVAVSNASGAGTVASSAASGSTTNAANRNRDDAIQARWNGPTSHLDWSGRGYATAEATFVGDRVASPGDQVQRTLTVANGGPSAAVMRVSLLVDEEVPELANNPDLARDIQLKWDVSGVTGSTSFAGLLANSQTRAAVAELQVPKGESVPVTVGFSMDADTTSGRTGNGLSTTLSFKVVVQMQGATHTDKTPDDLAFTGTEVLGWAAVGLGLLGVGALLALAARRRRCDDCGQQIERGTQWSRTHLADGSVVVQCQECCSAVVGLIR